MTLSYVTEPREPLRPVVTTEVQLQNCLTSLSEGTGPLAIDAERAHGHRYWPKAYLIQLRRQSSGTWLLDPIALNQDGVTNLGCLTQDLGAERWLIHASTQDLPCLRELGIYPRELFDTELAGRLLGEPSVSLAALLEAKLSIRLKKAHSAANWSKRPLPGSWLNYAALDVDYLPELAEILTTELVISERETWLVEECKHILQQFDNIPAAKLEPWRRLRNVNTLRSRSQLALAASLWQARDKIAQVRDQPANRIVPDDAIVSLASQAAEGKWPGPNQLAAEPGFNTRFAVGKTSDWLAAISQVAAQPPTQYPSRRPPHSGIPHPKNWRRRYPAAAGFWDELKPRLAELSEQLGIQQSLVAPPAIVQKVAFDFETNPDFATALQSQGARAWQLNYLVPVFSAAAAAS